MYYVVYVPSPRWMTRRLVVLFIFFIYKYAEQVQEYHAHWLLYYHCKAQVLGAVTKWLNSATEVCFPENPRSQRNKYAMYSTQPQIHSRVRFF